MPARHVEPAQAEEEKDRGQDEPKSGRDPSPGTVEPPPEVGGELLGLGPGQEHAEIQRVEKMGVADPAIFLDQLPVHDRDLPGRAAETDESQLDPESQGLRKGGMARHLRRWAALIAEVVIHRASAEPGQNSGKFSSFSPLASCIFFSTMDMSSTASQTCEAT